MDLTGKKVMITCGGGVGDLIMFTPALKSLKEKYNCHITFLTPRNADILRGLPYIDKVIFLPRGKFLGRYRCIPDLWQQDIIIFSDWQPQLLAMAHWLRVPFIAGIPRSGHRLTKYLNKIITHGVYDTDDYTARTHARMIEEALNISLSGDMTDIEVPDTSAEDFLYVDGLLQNVGVSSSKYIVLSPFTGLEERNWAGKEAINLVNLIKEKYNIPVLVLGTADTEKEARDISPYCLAGKTTLMQSVEIIRRALLLVSPDSGPMHIAGAVGTPVIALFSKDLPSRWAPKKKCLPIYLDYDCSPCDDETARHCQFDVRCMKNITAKMVMEKLDAFMRQ